MANNYGSCLLLGEPGTGKTTAAATAGAKEHPALFLDVDNKINRMGNLQNKLKEGSIITWPIDVPMSSIGLSRLVTTKHEQGGAFTVVRPEGYLKLVSFIEKLEKDKCIVDGRKVATIILDSYTSVQEHIKRLLLAVNQKSTMTLPLYGALLSNYEELNNTILGLPANIIFIAHIKLDKDEINGAIKFRPLIEGQMGDKIGKDFEEIYQMTKTVVGDKATYYMDTLGSNQITCRTSRGLPSRMEPDFSNIFNLGA